MSCNEGLSGCKYRDKICNGVSSAINAPLAKDAKSVRGWVA